VVNVFILNSLRYLSENPFNYSNIISNGDFSNGVINWSFSNAGSPIVNNNEIIFTPTNAPISLTATQNIYQLVNIINGHKYYGRCDLYGDEYSYLYIGSMNLGGVTTPNAYQEINGIYTSGVLGNRAFGIRTLKTSGFTQIKVKNLMIIDLTAIFGVNNEPTVEWCKASMPFKP
jgi:hypothetical protein